jgi:hypothetical protein
LVKIAWPGKLVDPANGRHVALAHVLTASWIGVKVPLLVTMTPKM